MEMLGKAQGVLAGGSEPQREGSQAAQRHPAGERVLDPACQRANSANLFPAFVVRTSNQGAAKRITVPVDVFRHGVEDDIGPVIESACCQGRSQRAVNRQAGTRLMRCLGGAGSKAVAPCRQRGIPNLLRQYHFLAAVGHKLLDGGYALPRSRIRRSKLRSRLGELLRKARSDSDVRLDLPALLLWILQGEGRKDLPYPFSLPHLACHRRCGQFAVERDRRLPRPGTRSEIRLLAQASEALAAYRRVDPQDKAVERLERGWAAFCQLRALLRLSDLQRYHQDLRQPARTPTGGGSAAFQPAAIILQYLDRYADGLVGHPVVRDATGRAVAVVDRTNNVIEQSFAIAKQGHLGRLGRAQLGRELEDQPAQVALAANLLHPDYVRILCGTLDQLPAAFAELDRQVLVGPSPLQRSNRDAELCRRNRAWAKDALLCPPLPPASHSQTPPELLVSN